MKKFSCLFLLLVLFCAFGGMNVQPVTAAEGLLTNPGLTAPVKMVAPETITTTPITIPQKPPVIDLPIKKNIALAYPVGGEVFMQGQPVIIEYKVMTPGAYVILISTDSGKTWSDLSKEIKTDSEAMFPYAVKNPGPFRIRVVSAADRNKYDEGKDCRVELGIWDGDLKAAADGGKINLSWKGVSCSPGKVTTYKVYRSTSPNVSSSEPLVTVVLPAGSAGGGTIAIADNDVTSGVRYYYKVVPVSGGQTFDSIYRIASAALPGTIKLTIGSPYMTVNGESMEIDPGRGTVPVIVNGRCFVPIRAIVEAMGGTVNWDGMTETITVGYNNNTIIMQIGSTEVIVNGVKKVVDVAPFVSDTGSTMVPIRLVSECLGCQVGWDQAAQSITITY